LEPTFRPADVSDIETLLVFMQEYYAFDQFPFDRDVARAALERLLSDPAFGRIWLIRDGAEAVGYVVLALGYSLEYHGRDAFLDEIYIRAGHRGQGIGARALAFLEDVCRDLGVNALHLEVERSNTVAQQVYRRAGFEDHDRFLMTKWIAR
jgi:GNAT superfamily N-acetyltransferase